MKVYKKFNGMSKKAKAALIGTTLYAATLALPVYAAVEQTGDRVVKTVDVDNLQTLDQLNVLYKTKIEEYSADKLLVPDEMDNLYIIESKRKEILKEKITNLNYT
ncbi:MAG: hypothetical protein KKA79_00335, partial [Nanoarchaeota archaeon]|nr:hypothetical protein [Nanoarchaeota archaeon]